MQVHFKSETGKRDILNLYDQKLKSLGIDFQSRSIETGFGKTHVIITGDPDNPPLILVHGSNSCAPIALEVYPNLSKAYRVYSIDVLAQPNKSAGNRLSMKDESYGQWMNEVIAQLKVENVTMVGFSFGGLVILKTLLNNEDRIKEVFLTAPAYIVNGNPLEALFRIFIPMKRFMKDKKQEHIEKFLRGLFTEKDQFAIQYLSSVFLHFDMDFTSIPTISKQEAGKIKTPITIIGAKKDILFPGRKMIKRAKNIFPSLKHAILLEESRHVQRREDNIKIEELIMNNDQ